MSSTLDLVTTLKAELRRAGITYAQLAAELGMAESTVGVTIHRMRRRYGDLLREEIAATVATPEEVDDELRHLLRLVSDVPGAS